MVLSLRKASWQPPVHGDHFWWRFYEQMDQLNGGMCISGVWIFSVPFCFPQSKVSKVAFFWSDNIWFPLRLELEHRTHLSPTALLGLKTTPLTNTQVDTRNSHINSTHVPVLPAQTLNFRYFSHSFPLCVCFGGFILFSETHNQSSPCYS